MLCFPPGNESYGRQIRYKSVIKIFAEAQTEAVRVIGQAIGTSKGSRGANLKAAELYVGAFKGLAKVEPIRKSLRVIISARSKKAENAQYQLSPFAVESAIPSDLIESDPEVVPLRWFRGHRISPRPGADHLGT